MIRAGYSGCRYKHLVVIASGETVDKDEPVKIVADNYSVIRRASTGRDGQPSFSSRGCFPFANFRPSRSLHLKINFNPGLLMHEKVI